MTRPVAKAKGTAQVAVYDANGTLVGLVDPKNLTAVAKPPAPTDPTDVADDIQKAVARARFRPDATTTEIRKAAGSVDDRFEALLKSMAGASDVNNVKAAVAKAATQMIVVGKVTSSRAIMLAKSAALDAGEAQMRIRKAATPAVVRSAIARRVGGR